MSQSHKLSSFEGLRGAAAFIVVISHLRHTFWESSFEDIRVALSSFPRVISQLLLAFTNGLFNGTFAVWLFWIMSAFVLALQFFLRSAQTPPNRAHDYLEDAFLRRYPRLLIPVLASVVFAYSLHAAGLMYNVKLSERFGDPYATGWLGSWHTFQASFPGAIISGVWETFFAYERHSTYNGVLWTMEKEFYGSLFLFAFLAIFGQRKSRVVLYILLALINRSLELDWLNAFVFGIALCDLFVNHDQIRHLKRAWMRRLIDCLGGRFATLALWIAVVAAAGLPNYRGVFYLFLGVAAVSLTILGAGSRRILSSRLPLFLGRISFGLYLIHCPIIFSFSCWAYLETVSRLGHIGAALLSSVLTCALSIIGGYFLFIVADRPGIRISRSFSHWVRNKSLGGNQDRPPQN